MKIYVGHASSMKYKEELYEPIRSMSKETNREWILPHETVDTPTNSIEQMKKVDLMIAEVSHASTGLGIELGWASMLEIPIVAIYKEGTSPSSAIETIARQTRQYQTPENLPQLLTEIVQQFQS